MNLESSDIKSLYKFASVNDNSLNALAECYAWFSSMAKLNDPFEGQVNLIGQNGVIGRDVITGWYESLKEISSGHGINPVDLYMLKNNFPEIISLSIEGQIENTNVLSLSFKSDKVDPLTNRLLWCHYANEMKGFCIEFKGGRLQSSLKERHPDASVLAIKTVYQDTPSKIDISKFTPKSENLRNLLFNMMQNKHKDWSYESELRFVSRFNGRHNYSVDAIKAIYLGGRMSESDKDRIKQVLRKMHPEVDVFSANVTRNYGISITRYDIRK
ncbi:TPA: DUF2971 domain-containing protein [Serratia fonticola]